MLAYVIDITNYEGELREELRKFCIDHEMGQNTFHAWWEEDDERYPLIAELVSSLDNQDLEAFIHCWW